jgi:hypothetical protein
MISKIIQFALLFTLLSGASTQASFPSIVCRSKGFQSMCRTAISDGIDRVRYDQNFRRGGQNNEEAILILSIDPALRHELLQVATEMRYNGGFAPDQVEERQGAIIEAMRLRYPHLITAGIEGDATIADHLVANRDPRNQVQ